MDNEQKPEGGSVGLHPVVGPVDATWRVELNCYCPACNEYVDLLTAPDFWDGRQKLQIAETRTERSNALEVQCPECDHEFIAKCEY